MRFYPDPRHPEWTICERESNVIVAIFMPFDGPECPPDEVLLDRQRLAADLEGGSASADVRELRNTWLWAYRNELMDRCRKRGGDWHGNYAAHLLCWRASDSVLKREDPERYALFAPLYAEYEAKIAENARRQRESGK